MHARQTLQIPQTTPFRTRSTLLQCLRTSCESRVGCVYYSSDRKVEFQQELAADSQVRASSLLRYRKQAVQYIRANRGPTIYFITPPRAEDRVLSARCAADRTKSEVDQITPPLLLLLLLLPWGSETRRAMCAAMQHRP